MSTKAGAGKIDAEQKASAQWSVYVLRCADNSLYTGVALDVNKRLDEHNGITKNGAKYTHARRPVELVYQEHADSRSDACKREYVIRKLKKSQKEKLINIKS
jgi:putative endonuclease